jgi:beta-glucosidase
MADPVAGPILKAAVAEMMGGAPDAAGLVPEGVDLQKMLDSFPIGRVGMFAADVDPGMIDALLAARPSDGATG